VIVLRIQRERFPADALDEGGYGQGWRITRAALEAEARPDAWVLHPGPVIRGEEMEGEVADGDRSLILEQVSAGVAVRQAVLLDVLKVGVSWRQAMSRDA
jgi:aspartate carbamoyltransferase catalytic subunit